MTFRANRIVDGHGILAWDTAGTWAIALPALLVICGACAWLPQRSRSLVLLGAGFASYCVLLAALGIATQRLMPAVDSPARVSIARGAWLAFAGIAVLWYQGARSAPRAWRVAVMAGAAFVTVAAVAWGGLARLGIALEYRTQAYTFWPLLWRHVGLTLSGTAIAALVGVPLGIAAARRRGVRAVAIPAAGLVQTVPSLALFGLLMVPLAMLRLPTIGALPALIALTLYALLPIVRDTYLGVAGVDAAAVDAGRGMGMSRRELLWRVELPLALPLMLEGVRAALVLTVGITAVMAIGGAHTLGTLVFLGWGQQAADLVLLGAVPMVVLSVLADQAMRGVKDALVSPGISSEEATA